MSIQPWVTVEPPDSRGLRKISIEGKTVGSAWSFHELRNTLIRLGYPETIDMENPASIYWRGGDSNTWPDRPWRRHAINVLMIGGLLGSAIVHLVIGWPDALRALTFAQRIVGSLFILLGALQGVAALAAFDYWGRRQFRPSGAIVSVGALITVATVSLLLFMWLEEKEYTPYLLAFIPLWLWSLWALHLLIPEKPWKDMPYPRKFAAGVAATALLTAVSLAYSIMYQPTSAPIHFILKAEFGTPRVHRDRQSIHIPIKLYVKNDGGIPVYIINDNYTVYGETDRYSEQGEKGVWWRIDTEFFGVVKEYEMHTPQQRRIAISSGHFHRPGSWLESGEEYAKETVIRLPKNAAYDTIDVELRFDFMRKDRGKIGADFSIPRYSWSEDAGRYYCPPKECAEYVTYHGRVHHNNNLVNVTRRPRYVAAFWSPDATPTVFISSFNFKKKDEFSNEYEKLDEAEIKRERERYGHGLAFTNAEIPFAELLSRSSGT
jgi:hypothetical protein